MTAEGFERLMVAVVRDLMPAPSEGLRQGEAIAKPVPLPVAGVESETPRALALRTQLATAAIPAVLRNECEVAAIDLDTSATEP